MPRAMRAGLAQRALRGAPAPARWEPRGLRALHPSTLPAAPVHSSAVADGLPAQHRAQTEHRAPPTTAQHRADPRPPVPRAPSDVRPTCPAAAGQARAEHCLHPPPRDRKTAPSRGAGRAQRRAWHVRPAPDQSLRSWQGRDGGETWGPARRAAHHFGVAAMCGVTITRESALHPVVGCTATRQQSARRNPAHGSCESAGPARPRLRADATVASGLTLK
jgi:hypothetical protein